MFRKKHSQINIQLQHTTYSPFRKNSNCSPLTRTPDRTNLSPMKAQQKNKGFSTKSPRKQFTNQQFSASKIPLTKEANFEAQLEFLGNTILSQYESGQRQTQTKFGPRGFNGFEGTAFSNISNFQTSDRHMKESKKIFSNVISKMNSDKKRTEITSNQCSIFEQSRPFPGDISAPVQGGAPIASFKALKQIKLIESVQPLPPPPLLQKSSSKKSNNQESNFNKTANKQSIKKGVNEQEQVQSVAEFKIEGKRQKIVQLINQSFSVNAPPFDKVFQNTQIKKEELVLGKQANILESMYLDDSYEFKQLNTLLSKLEDKRERENIPGENQAQSVRISMESAKLSLTMNPFI